MENLEDPFTVPVFALSQDDSDLQLSSLTDINLEKAIQLLHDKQKENNDLREALKDNITLMKQHYKTMLDWKNKISERNTINKERYTESMNIIQDLKEKNLELEQSAQQQKIQFEQKIEELDAINKNLKSEISTIEKKYHSEKNRNDQLQGAIGEHASSENAVEVLVAHTEESSEKISQMEQMLQDCEVQKNNLEITNTHLTNDVRTFKEHTDQLINDLKNMSLIKETIQLENNKLTEENVYLRREYQVLLTKHSSKNARTEDLNSKMEDYELASYEKLSNFWNDTYPPTTAVEGSSSLLDNSSKGNESHMSGIMSQLNQERSQVDILRVKNKSLEKRIQNMQDEIETKNKELKREHFEEIQKLQKDYQTEIETLCKNNPDRKVVESMAVDHETLKHQVMNLLSEVKEVQDERRSTEGMLANKTTRCRQLEETNIRLQMEMDRQRKQDAELIQTLQYSIQNYESKLSTEMEQTQIRQEQNRKLRESFFQLVDDYKEMLELNHQLEHELKNNSHEKLMGKIDHLTAQLIAAEESLSLKNQTLENLQEKIKKCTAENDDIPLLRAQADIYKSDFDAERAAHEKEHQENKKLKEDLQNIELQNRELLDQLEALSREQLSEMRQRVYPRYPTGTYNRNPFQGGSYEPDPRVPSSGYYMLPQSVQTNNEATQHEEETEALNCPLCGGKFPDQDSLKLHVAEHL